MSDNNPNDGFDIPELDDMELDFPGAEPEDLTAEVRDFTFDADFLEDPPAAADAPPEQAGAYAGREDELADVFRKLTRPKAEERPEPKAAEEDEPDRGGKVEALTDAFRRITARKTAGEPAVPEKTKNPPQPAPPDNARKPARTEMTVKPAKQEKPARQSRVRAGKVDPALYDGAAIEPVTVGRDLRADQMLVYDSELDEIDYTDDEDLPELRDYMPIRFRRYGRIGIGGGLLYALCVISVSIILACMGWMFAADVLALNKEELSAVVTIEEYEPGEGDPVVNDQDKPIKVDIDQVATELKNNGIIEFKWLFKLFSRISHAEAKIDPGTFDVSTELDYRAIVTALQYGSGNQEITKITFPEGFTTEQIFTLLEENHICTKKELYDAAANYDFGYEFLEELETGDPNRLEGYLFPDTYEFYQGEDAAVAINRFLRNLNSKLTDDMRKRAENSNLTVHELLTVASLIEKESAGGEESATIASVIYNRLNSDWKLELDSTINYIKGTSTFHLTYEDLEIDDPYNTYMYKGLPPGPICNPGADSINAALYPDATNYWYWYASEGETHFFTNSDDFNAYAAAHPFD